MPRPGNRYVSTFGDVPEGETLLYLNSLDNLSAAINLGSFAQTYGIGSGPEWRLELAKPRSIQSAIMAWTIASSPA